jgi:hypothetical protein
MTPQHLILDQQLNPTSADAIRPRRRAFHHKEKGGCLTCTARHVKCDRTVPTCNRCRDAKRRCLGYPPPLTGKLRRNRKKSGPRKRETFSPSQRDAAKRRVSLKNVTTQSELVMSDARSREYTFVLTSPLDDTHTTAHERSSLDMFRRTVARFHGQRMHSAAHIWETFIPQVAHRYPTLRNALVAIGTITLSLFGIINEERIRTALLHARKYMSRSVSDILDASVAFALPKVVLALVALAFWQYESMKGAFEDSIVHIEGAARLATEFEGRHWEEEAVAAIIPRYALLTRRQTDDFSHRYPELTARQTSMKVRKAAGVLLCQRTLAQVAIEEQEMNLSDTSLWSVTEKETILRALERLRSNLECVLKIWMPQVSAEDVADVPSLWPGNIASPYFENLNTGVYSAADLCAECSTAVSTFVSHLIQDDRPARIEYCKMISMMDSAAAGANPH